MRSEIAAFVAEVDDLAAVLEPIPEAAWSMPTQFKDWTIDDVVLHLFASDQLGLVSLRSAEAYTALRSDMQRARQAGLSMIDETRCRFPMPKGRRLLDEWRDQARQLAAELNARDPKTRVAWSGPGMSVRTFATARQMESWAHGSEIYDALGLDRVEQDRIHNIAVLGIKTFSWSFSNRGLPVPETTPYLELSSPSGVTWQWNEAGGGEMISGEAAEFCAVVTQVRNVLDTGLVVHGVTSSRWMAIAQCFAGPPALPPVPGSRYRAAPTRRRM